MKKIAALLCASLLFLPVFAQDADDDFFSDDDFFFEDDGIVELEETSSPSVLGSNISSTTDLSHGNLFQDGSIKIGGRFDTSVATSTVLWQDKDDFDFGDSLANTTLTPTASALLTIDARPTQVLRMYTKFGLGYPFETKANSSATTTETQNPFYPFMGDPTYFETNVSTQVSDYLKVKELFTDFSIADRAFFRFGLHTVTWGTGYFFSPISDIINTSSIDPENTDAQVDGCLNLRTQITFPGTQNCLWFYVVPSTKITTAASYAKDTALAGKADLVFGNWEFGVGGYYKYENAPKAILTATGGFKKISLFGEALYQYGADSEWSRNTDWEDKTNIFQLTAGASYFWKTPNITLAGQYYYDSNDKDMKNQYLTKGHNIAAVASFGRIFGTTDFSATIFTMANFGKDDLNDLVKAYLETMGISSTYFSSITVSAMMTYSPTKEMSFTAGPYLTWKDVESKPNVAFNLTAKLGGGKF